MQTTPVTVRVGASSPTAAVGATGRVAATTISSSAAASIRSTPQPVAVPTGRAVSPGDATAPDGTALLSAPLGLQATVLSQPSFYPSLGEDMGDFTEEGDILFPVLGNPWARVQHRDDGERRETTRMETLPPVDRSSSEAAGLQGDPLNMAERAASASPSTATSTRSTTPQSSAPPPTGYVLSSGLSSSTALCVQPVLTLPRKVGVSLACEVFRALLSFHNAAAYPLTQAHFHIGVAQPPAPLRRALLRRTVPVIPPKSNYTTMAAVPLSDAGTYSLAVAVDYNDPSGRQRLLTWNSTLNIEQPIMEVQPRRLTFLRPALSTKDTASMRAASAPSWSRTYAWYQLAVGLKNMSSVPLYLTSAEIQLPTLKHHSGTPLFCRRGHDFVAVEERGSGDDCSDSHTTAAAATTTTTTFLMPGDTQSLIFRVGVCAEELRHATVVHGQGGSITRLLSPRLTSFGQVTWTWCRANGETGTARSAPLRVARLVAEPEVLLHVARVTPTQRRSAHLVEGVEDGAGSLSPSSPSLLLAGSPVTVDFVLVNHSAVHRYDVALKVRVERLAPQWLYTGPTVRLLGLLDAGSTLSFSLTLLPWQAGWLAVLQSALEVVDARMPEAVLWPPAATSLMQPVEGPGAAVATAVEKDEDRSTLVATVPAVAQCPMQATLPADGDVLCEVLVL